jgi:hypothetical protein
MRTIDHLATFILGVARLVPCVCEGFSSGREGGDGGLVRGDGGEGRGFAPFDRSCPRHVGLVSLGWLR